MCVIAYKAKDVRFPSNENIGEMWSKNPDGAGVMWRDDEGLIHWKKGFMSLKKFRKWVKRNRAWLESVECALHFRITTHGGTSAGNCHPFAVDGGDSHRLEGTARRVLMHNGMLPLKPRANDISDSGELALRLSECESPHKSMDALNECLAGNRVILMDECGTHFYGDAFKRSADAENDGILYSNLHWEFVPSAFRFAPASLSPSREQIVADPIWGSNSGRWIDPSTGEYLDIRSVDLDSVSEEEYEAYQESLLEEMEEVRREFNLTAEEIDDAVNDAEYCGMGLREYVESCYGYESARPAAAVA